MTTGRPRKVIDYEKARRLAEIQCTIAEIAHVLDVSDTKLKRDEPFRTIYEKARETGRTSLRRLQWKAAKAGNTAMLIWLGKQYLGQADKQELSGGVAVTRPVSELTDAELIGYIKGGRSGGTTAPTQSA
jgi:hypothetical protein